MLNILMGIIITCTSAYSIDSLYINTDEFSVISEYAKFTNNSYEIIEDDIKAYAYEVYSENEGFMFESIDIIKEMGMKFFAENRIEHISITDKYVSALLFFSSYTGGTHGIHYYKTMTYEKNTSQPMKLSDIIDSKSLGNIADYCRHYIAEEKQEADEDYGGLEHDSELMDGIKPIWEHYENFVIHEDSMTIIFNEYEIAPYYMGAFTVNVPDSVYDICGQE